MDIKSVDVLISQLADLYAAYRHEGEMSAGYGHPGPLEHEALPTPVALLEAAVAVKAGRPSREMDAVRVLLRILWQMYDAGGTSMGRSVQARIVEVAMILAGPASSGFAAIEPPLFPEVIRQCEEHAYEVTRVARNGDAWDEATARFRAAVDHRNRNLSAAQEVSASSGKYSGGEPSTP